jgi:hypothetical protein
VSLKDWGAPLSVRSKVALFFALREIRPPVLALDEPRSQERGEDVVSVQNSVLCHEYEYVLFMTSEITAATIYLSLHILHTHVKQEMEDFAIVGLLFLACSRV